MSKFFNELKRRNVIKAAIAYAVVAWVLLQVASVVLPITGAPDWVLKTFSFFLIIGFPIWIFISWVYEVTPEGLKKTEKVSKDQSITATTNKRLNVLIIAGIIAAIVVSFINKPSLGSNNNAHDDVALDHSIAVLPFDDMSSGGDTEWFCDGVTEDILTNLSKLKDLKVISRTSTERYKDTDKSIPEIAKELGVSYVVEGSVRKHENQVIITAQLIDANDKHIWAENYNDSFKEVFKIQQDVSKKIVAQLRIAISPTEEEVLTTVPTDNIEAYELVLKGREIMNTSHKKGEIKKAAELFEQAIDLDPNYAEAHAEVAYANLMLWFEDGEQDDSLLNMSREHIDKALLINPNTGRAYTTLAIIHDEVNDGWEESAKDYERAIAINPNDARAYLEYGLHFKLDPKNKDNTKFLYYSNKAQELDPLSPINNMQKIDALTANAMYEEAEAHLNRSKRIISEDARIFLYGHILEKKYKDLSKPLDFYLEEINKYPKNTKLLQRIADIYDGYLNDDTNYSFYLKKAYQLDSTDTAIARNYGIALIENKQFSNFKKLYESDNFKMVVSNKQLRRQALFYYHYYKMEYEKAGEILKDSLFKDRTSEKILLHAQLRNKNKVYKFFKDSVTTSTAKAFGFAILKERDSMYHYLLNDKTINAAQVNSRFEFDPYRKEPQYIEFLKKEHIPVIEKFNGKVD